MFTYYTISFVDRDMYMRFAGGGIGHYKVDISDARTTEPQPSVSEENNEIANTTEDENNRTFDHPPSNRPGGEANDGASNPSPSDPPPSSLPAGENSETSDPLSDHPTRKEDIEDTSNNTKEHEDDDQERNASEGEDSDSEESSQGGYDLEKRLRMMNLAPKMVKGSLKTQRNDELGAEDGEGEFEDAEDDEGYAPL